MSRDLTSDPSAEHLAPEVTSEPDLEAADARSGGDPTRAPRSLTATELAAERPVTRQAVAKQLSALEEAGLLRATRRGRETRYEVTPAPLEDAVEWMVSVGSAWDQRLAALRRTLARKT